MILSNARAGPMASNLCANSPSNVTDDNFGNYEKVDARRSSDLNRDYC